MTVNYVSSVNPLIAKLAPKTAASTSSGNSLDSSQFMTILMTQLTHQNPLEPMSNQEMMSQFAQLNSLEELRQMNTSMGTMADSNQVNYLASLIGKTVRVNSPDGKILEGVVDGVVVEKANPQLQIGNVTVPLSDVLQIKGALA